MQFTWRSWLARSFPHLKPRRTSRSQRRARLRPEQLESRVVPAVYDVTTTADVVDASDNVLSLREAVLAANASAGVADTINLPSGTYVLTRAGADEDNGATGDLDIWDDVTVRRQGADAAIVDGNLTDRVFDVQAGTVAFLGLTVRNGRVMSLVAGSPDGQGGGVRGRGAVTLTDCLVTGNQARGVDATATAVAGAGLGGGLYQLAGTLTLTNTTVTNNEALGGAATVPNASAANVGGAAGGGGVAVAGGVLAATTSTVTNNRAAGGAAANTAGAATGGAASGGGVFVTASGAGGSVPGRLNLASSLIADNRAEGGAATAQTTGTGGAANGGGARAVSPVDQTFTASTVARNQAVGGAGTGDTAGFGGAAFGGGLQVTPTVNVINSTVSANRAAGGAGTTTGAGTAGAGGDARGGGLSVGGGVVRNSTLTLNAADRGTGNRAAGTGMGGGSAGATSNLGAMFISSVLAGNTASTSAPDLYYTNFFPPASQGNNFLGDGSGATGFAHGVNGDQVGTAAAPLDPRLGSLANNGGPTPTHAPLTGSLLVNRGTNTGGLATDQRGPGFPRVIGALTDVGAVESPFTPPSATISPLANVTAGGAPTHTVTVTFADDTAVDVASLGDGDLRLTGPNGVAIPAVFAGVNVNTNGTPRTATYRFTPPGGGWDPADYGTYTVRVAVAEVFDTAGGAAYAEALGSFRVLIPDTFVVTNADGLGAGSLRDAVAQANARADVADTVTFDPTFFSVPRTIRLNGGTLTVTDPVTVVGPGAGRATVDGNGSVRLFRIDGPGQIAVTIAGLTLTNGRVVGTGQYDGGGAVYSENELVTLRDCVIIGNRSEADGGAIRSSGTLTVERTTISGNVARSDTSGFVANGGGIAHYDGAVNVLASTVADNEAYSGGGIFYVNSGTLTVQDSTLSSNRAVRFSGGGIRVYGTPRVLIRNSTLSGNQAGGSGGGVALPTGSNLIGIENSTITGNRAEGPNALGGGVFFETYHDRPRVTSSIVSGNVAPGAPDISFGGALELINSAVGSPDGFTPAVATGNLPYGTDLLLGPLADNGGPTRTHALLPGSPAIDKGSNPAALTTDQRGRSRTWGPIDIGAYEYAAERPIAVGPFADVTVAGGTAHTFQVTYYDNVALAVGTLGHGDVRISGPNGFNALAEFVSVNAPTDGTPRIATYRFTPPGGTWDGGDNGTYLVAAEPSQVADTLGNTVVPGPIGSFRVLLSRTFTVITDADAGPGSLREALERANASALADTVVFDPVYFATPRTIALTSGALPITDSVTVTGPGAANLTITGGNVSRLFALDGAGLIPVTLSGLRLTGGRAGGTGTAGRGGAIFASDEMLTLRDVVLTGNAAQTDGGAIASERDGRLTLERVVATGNTAGGAGGAVYFWGDISVGGAPIVVRDSTISGNTAGAGGGGLNLDNSAALLLERSTVADNTSRDSGGGVFQRFGNVTLRDSTISGNRNTDGDGGGVALVMPYTVLVRNSTLSGNTAVRGTAGSGFGGGLHVRFIRSDAFPSTITIQNSTITDNRGTVGGVWVTDDPNGTFTVASSVIAGNVGEAGYNDLRSGYVLLTNSLIGGGGFTLAAGSGNNLPYGMDPQLAPLGAYGGLTRTHALRPSSPLIDRGSNPASLTTDQRGRARSIGLAPDIGAVEGANPPPTATATLTDVTAAAAAHTFTVRYSDDTAVRAASLGTGDVRVTGPNGFDALAEFVSVDAATDGTPRTATYRVAAPGGGWDLADNGTYAVALEANQVADVLGDFAAAATLGTFRAVLPATFVVTTDADSGTGSLREAVALANAAASATPDLIRFDPTFFSVPRTIALTGGVLTITDSVTVQGPGANLLTLNGGDTSRIFTVNGPGTLAVTLAGLRFTAGRMTGTTAVNTGGAIYNQDEALTVRDSVFMGNTAAAGGGAIGSFAGTLTVENSTLTQNSSPGPGGAVFFGDVTGQTTPPVVIRGSTLTQNSSTARGGAVSAGAWVRVESSAVSNNTAASDGGGIYSSESVTVVGSTVSGNTAAGDGGGIHGRIVGLQQTTVSSNTAGGGGGISADRSFGLQYSTVADNTTTLRSGGGVNLRSLASSSLVRNSTISGNRSAARGGGIAAPEGGGSLAVENSTIVANFAASGDGGGGIWTTMAHDRLPGLTVRSSVISGNTSSGPPDIFASRVTMTHSLVGSADGWIYQSGTGSGNNLVTGTDPRLGPLADNGGPTRTHLPLAGSPLLEVGTNPSDVATDQRGLPRLSGAGVDVGAVEVASVTPWAVGSLPEVVNRGTGADAYTFTVTYRDTLAVAGGSLGTGDVRIVGPNGFSALASLAGVDAAGDGTPRTATYRVTPPGGAWDGADNGTYTALIEAGQVTNTLGNAVPAGLLGQFRVLVPERLMVTTTADSGPGSLREAVLRANGLAGPDVIEFDPAAFATPQTITLTSGEMHVTDSVTIRGPGAGRVTVSGNDVGRVFRIDGPGVLDVALSGLTLTRGRYVPNANGFGGGALLSNGEHLTLDDLTVTASRAVGGGGGLAVTGQTGSLVMRNSRVLNNAIESGGVGSSAGGGLWAALNTSVELRGSTFEGNTTVALGGGASINASLGGPIPTVTVVDCTFANNTAGGGGGLAVGSSTQLVVRNTTISGNTAAGEGGGLYVASLGAVTIENSTITQNRTSLGGGVSFVPVNSNQALVVTSSVVSGNTATSANSDIRALNVQTTLTRSAVGDPSGFTLTPASGNNLAYGANLLLGPLTDNGGPTRTHLPLAGSPLIDAGTNPSGLATDQRGFGMPRNAGAGTDIGAVEVVPAGTPTATAGPLPDVYRRGGTLYTMTVRYADDAAIRGSSLGTGDVRVTGPNGFSTLATFAGVDAAGDGTPRTATYTFAPPGDVWDAADDGTYTVALEPNQVADTGGTFVPAVPLGRFNVAVPVGVREVRVNDGTEQRSRVTSLTVTFEGVIQFVGPAEESFRLRRADGTLVGLSALVDHTGGRTTVQLSFTGAATEFGSLTDGAYTLAIFGSTARGPGGLLVDADGDGVPAGDAAIALHRLFGDSDGDRDVDNIDLLRLRGSFGLNRSLPGYLAYYDDFDDDGDVDNIDLLRLRQRFGIVLAP